MFSSIIHSIQVKNTSFSENLIKMALEATVLWHDLCSTWKQRNSFLFKKNFMSDCSFILTENGKTTRIPAHKYILGGFSLDFYNLFYLMEADSNEIPITDVSLKSFTDFLMFVYSEKTLLTQANVWDVLKLAHRYSSKNLKKHCEDKILEMVSKSNCIEFMDRCSPYETRSVTTKCLQMMDPKYFFSPYFLEIKLETLVSILKVEESCISEIELFRAANKWAIRKCERMNILPSGDNKRMVLGAAVMNIRFAAMTVEEFAECTDTNSILTGNEGMQVFRYIGNRGTSDCIFSGINRFKRNFGVIDFLTGCGGCHVGFNNGLIGGHINQDPFKLSFHLLNNIQICGFGVQLNSSEQFPTTLPTKENVTIKLLDCNCKVLLENVCTVTVGAAATVFDLLFKDGYNLQAGFIYYLELQLGNGFKTNNLIIPQIHRMSSNGAIVILCSSVTNYEFIQNYNPLIARSIVKILFD